MRRWRYVAAALGAAVLAALALDRAFPPDMSRYHDLSRVAAARDGTPLRVYLSGDEKWRLRTTPSDVDPLYLDMLKAYEDKRFDRHFGVDPVAALRAAMQGLAAGRRVSGASTLTMQAARLLEPRPRTLGSKVIEAFRAAQLEARYDKAEILSIYLTLAPFGGAVEGVRAASLKLLGRPPGLLTPAEAALLIALPQAPSARRPDRYPARALQARGRVLARAEKAGVLSAADAAAAEAAPLPSAYLAMPFLAPHAADDATGHGARDALTTLDAGLQRRVEDRMRRSFADLSAPATAAAIVVDRRSAEVRALVGGPDFFDQARSGMVDMTTAIRSPGSALKPFIYGLAIDRLQIHPHTLIQDTPYREAGYAPTNFDAGYAGDVTIADALTRSLNIPAVKVLKRLGPERFDAALANAGFELSFDRESGDAGLALALGGVGVDLRTLVRAYVALAEGAAPSALVLEEGDHVEWRPLMGVPAANAVRRVLAAASPPKGHRPGLGVAYKTGTSYGYRDAWAVGLYGEFIIGVWVGRPDGGVCAGCVGGAVAAPILFDIAGMLPAPPTDVAPTAFPPPPAHLRRFEREARLASVQAPRAKIRFPADGARLSLGASGVAPLVAVGGAPPYRWLADGAPLDGASWRPAGPGWRSLLAIDRNGAVARAKVFIEPRR